MMNSYLSQMVPQQAEKYGNKIALKYRDYDTDSWISVTWNQFANKVRQVSNALIALGIKEQENIFWSFCRPCCDGSFIRYQFGDSSALYFRGR